MSLTFNGTSSNLQIASRLIPTAYPFTEFCWIKPRISTQSTFALSTGSADNAEEFGAYVDGGNTGKVRGWAAHTANNGTVNSTSNVVTSWQPMMIVHNSATSCDVYYAAGAKVNGSTAQPPNFASMTRFAVGARAGTLNFWFDGDIAEVAVWSSGLVQADYDSLAAGAAPETIQAASLVESWSLLTQATTQVGTKGATLTNGASTTQGGTHPITRAPTGTASGASLTATATITPGSASGSSPGVALGANIVSITSLSAGSASAQNTGTLTTKPLKNNAGTVLASETGVTVNVYHQTTGALIVQKTGLTTDASGVATVTDALIVPGTTYAYEPVLSAGRRRLPVKAAA